MSDFNITAVIGANVKNFKDGIAEARGAMADFRKATEGTMGKVADSLMSGGKMFTAGITAPAIAGVTAAVKSFADLEQAVGGIETMFKDNAKTVIRNSESAYRRAGVSGVSYMEQVTSFSATLLQGLGGDTVKAAEYADKAIVDMADNSSKMGTDLSMLQNAYQGFSRGQFNMLDNLKLGYSGTQEEMARLVNESGVMNGEFEATADNVKDIPFDQLIEAIHITQERMGITGTTSKEAAETVSGSFGTMKAAAQNFVAGLGDANQDTQVLFDTMVETAGIFVQNVKGVLSTIWDNLPFAEWQKWIGLIVVAAGPVMMAVGGVINSLLWMSSKIGGAVLGLKNLRGGFIAAKTGGEVAGGGMAKLGAVFGSITGPMWLVIAAVAAVIAGIVYLWKTNEDFRNKVIEIWNAIKEFLVTALETVKTFLMDTWNNILTWWNENQEAIKNKLLEVWNAISAFIMPIVESISRFLMEIWNTIGAWWHRNQQRFYFEALAIWTSIKVMFESVMNLIKGIIQFGLEKITAFWDVWGSTITTIVKVVWEFVKAIFTTRLNNILNIVKLVIGQIRATFQFAMTFIRNLVQIALSAMSGDWGSVMDGIKGIAEGFGSYIKKTFQNMMEFAEQWVKDGIREVKNLFNSLKNIDLWAAGKAIIDGFLGGLKSAYEGVKNFIGGIAGWIAENKGPISYDKKLLITHGQSIMQGLNKGLTDQFQSVKRNVSSMAGAISNVVADAGGSLNNAVANSLTGGYSLSTSGQLTVQQQPAYITVDLGGRAYKAFVEDISTAQAQTIRFEESYGL